MKELIKNILFISIILCYGRANTVLGQTLKISEVLTKIEENNSALLSYQNKILAANELVNGAGAWMPTKVSTEWDMIPYSLDYKMSQLRSTSNFWAYILQNILEWHSAVINFFK